MKNDGYTWLIGATLLLSLVLAGAPTRLSGAQFQNPIKAAREAWEKSRQQAKQQAEQQKQQQQQQQQNRQSANPQNSSAAGETPQSASGQGSQSSAAPWTPPDAATAAPVKLDPAKLPDVVGLHLGMTATEAAAAVHKAYPVNIIQHFPLDWWPDTAKPNLGFTILSARNQSDVDMYLSFTAPPGPQLLWRVSRIMRALNINHQVFLNDLRAKYGRESFAINDSGQVVNSDAQIGSLVWLYKENGEQIKISALTPFQISTVSQCWGSRNLAPRMPYDNEWATPYPDFCKGIVALQIHIGPNTIAYGAEIKMEDIALAMRTAETAHAFLARVAAQQKQEQIEKSKQVKPVL